MAGVQGQRTHVDPEVQVRFPERLLREPLVDWDFKPLPWWGELVAGMFCVLFFFAAMAFVAWQPKLDR